MSTLLVYLCTMYNNVHSTYKYYAADIVVEIKKKRSNVWRRVF